MRHDLKNEASRTEAETAHETLKFYFTPVDEPRGDRPDHPHASRTTFVPEVVDALKGEFHDDVLGVNLYANEHTVLVRRERILEVCRFLKEAWGFTYLADLGGIDRFTETDRYEVFYNLVALERRQRIRVKIRIDEDDVTADSVTPVFRGANWSERECWDMLGIRFNGHPDLRRMYMPEDFEYHPQRKEFPLLGIPGSLPLPPQVPGGDLTLDPFAAAHGSLPVKSYQEPSDDEKRP
jgi:NADH-quinone oxidoreductase subunit C